MIAIIVQALICGSYPVSRRALSLAVADKVVITGGDELGTVCGI